MKVKVCGITTLEQLVHLKDAGADYAGLIFYEGSKRFVVPHLANKAAEVKEVGIKKIGVFVNADYDTIIKAINDYGLYAVQLHGDETDEFCLELMDKVEVIKVFRLSGINNINNLTAPFENVCHYFLFDTETKEYGGSGKQFDWNILQNAIINKPFFLSGGIGPDDVDKLNAFEHSQFYGVDVNSCFEKGPGIKNMTAVQDFINNINRYKKSQKDFQNKELYS